MNLQRALMRRIMQHEARNARHGILPVGAAVMTSDASGNVFVNGEWINNARAVRNAAGHIVKVILREEDQ